MFHVEHSGVVRNSRRSRSGARICRPDAEECSMWNNNLARRKSGSVQHLWPCKLRRRLRICMFHVERLALWCRVIAMVCFRDFGPSREIRARRRAWLRSSNLRHCSTWNEGISQSNYWGGIVTWKTFTPFLTRRAVRERSAYASGRRSAEGQFHEMRLRIATALLSRFVQVLIYQLVGPTEGALAAPASK